MFLKTSQYWSLFLIKLQAFFLQNTYGCCFWIFAAAKTSFSLIPRFHLGKMKIFHMNTRKWASPASRDSMARLSGKKITFLRTKYFLDAASSCFCRHEILFCATSTHFCRHQITFCATSNFLLQQKITFRWTPNFCSGHRLECYVMEIYFYCHVATIICQKINKLSFLCVTRKLVSFFVHHNFFIFSFYITHCQHVVLLCSGSGPGNK